MKQQAANRVEQTDLSSDEFERFFSLIPDLACIATTDGYFRKLNSAWEEVLGYSLAELLAVPFLELVHPDDREATLREMARQRAGEATVSFVNRYRCRNGTYRLFEWKATPAVDDTFFYAVARDITGRRRPEEQRSRAHVRLCAIADAAKEEELVRNQEQLKSLAIELSLAEERERRRIATELHDEIGQNLALAKIKLDNLRTSTRGGGAIREIGDLIKNTIREVRSLTFQISPPLLYEVGFEAALEWLAEQFESKHGLRIRINDDGKPKQLDEELGTTLYHVIRELLMNVVKHAQARQVVVDLRRERDRMIIVVKDDGRGFDVAQYDLDPVRLHGFGLFNNRQRIMHLGGELVVASRIHQGTEVTISVPLRRQERGKP